MRFGELKSLLRLKPVDLRRVLADVLQRPGLAEDAEINMVETAMLCLADFCETYFSLPEGSCLDLLRRLWPDLKKHYEDQTNDHWAKPYQVGVVDRRYAAWPGRAAFLDLVTLEEVVKLPGNPVQTHAVDVTEYFHRAVGEVARRSRTR